MVFLACAIFQTDLVIHDMDATFVLTMFSVLNSGLNLFLYCYFGQRSTDHYAAFADCAYESDWMSLPINLKKPIIMMIVYARKPLCYHGYGIVTLDSMTFLKVFLVFEIHFSFSKGEPFSSSFDRR